MPIWRKKIVLPPLSAHAAVSINHSLPVCLSGVNTGFKYKNFFLLRVGGVSGYNTELALLNQMSLTFSRNRRLRLCTMIYRLKFVLWMQGRLQKKSQRSSSSSKVPWFLGCARIGGRQVGRPVRAGVLPAAGGNIRVPDLVFRVRIWCSGSGSGGPDPGLVFRIQVWCSGSRSGVTDQDQVFLIQIWCFWTKTGVPDPDLQPTGDIM